MALPQKLYKIQEAGGAGRCFFNSVHDSILSRENEYNPKKQIITNIYTCFGIPKADYDSKATLEEKKLQFNRDIRTDLANKVREEPSEFQKQAKDNFIELYNTIANRAPIEQIQRQGAQDINAYPGYYELLISPDTYALHTADNELFELQREGAISADAIRAMGKRGFYNLIARVLEKNNYSTYALSPIIFLLNYLLSKCQPEGYIINIIATGDIQAGAPQLTKRINNRDLLSIPVHKTGYAHYQAIVQVPLQAGQDYYIQQTLLEDETEAKDKAFKQQAMKEIEQLIQEIENKYAGFKKKAIVAKVPKDIKQKLTGDLMSMYIIPKDFFEKDKWYKSEQEAGGEPIVQPFLVIDILPKGKTSYELQIQMIDGSKSSIVIDTLNGHFVSYVEVSQTQAQAGKSTSLISKSQSQSVTPKVKPKSFNEFKKGIEDILGPDITSNSNSSIPMGTPGQGKLSLEEFKKKITGKFGGYRKTRKPKRKVKKSKRKTMKFLRNKSSTRRK